MATVEFFKLASLPKGQKHRKVLRLLERLENSCIKQRNDELLDEFYLKQIFNLVIDDLPSETSFQVKQWLTSPKKDKTLNIINTVKHSLYKLTGCLPSEWDLILPNANKDKAVNKRVFENIFIYAEDIRTPFNIGSIFRTAESFGVEKIFLSPDCISPESPRARRSAMGCVDYIPWERRSIEELPKDLPIIALETGGSPIGSFQFPNSGILMIGSEELGLSPQALALAKENIVTIPMYGIKASINVGVAFGIFMQRWVENIARL
ncbi:MAG: RNA methyltransferase [Treponema sp.]|nr:MAG: RNA methyltransferase [Treponema sp.]